MRKTLIVVPVLVALGFAASVYFSPYYTIYAMKKAVDRRDAQAFSQYIDFPALRADINAQLQAKVREQLSTPGTRNNPLASLGAAIVGNLARPKLDAQISPAGIMLMLNRGELRAATGEANAGSGTVVPSVAAPDTAVAPPAAPASDTRKSDTADAADKLASARQAHYWIRYTDASTVVATNTTRHMTFTFKRTGLWSWHLVGAHLPVEDLQ